VFHPSAILRGCFASAIAATFSSRTWLTSFLAGQIVMFIDGGATGMGVGVDVSVRGAQTSLPPRAELDQDVAKFGIVAGAPQDRNRMTIHKTGDVTNVNQRIKVWRLV